jgi:hypothetical protein
MKEDKGMKFDCSLGHECNISIEPEGEKFKLSIYSLEDNLARSWSQIQSLWSCYIGLKVFIDSLQEEWNQPMRCRWFIFSDIYVCVSRTIPRPSREDKAKLAAGNFSDLPLNLYIFLPGDRFSYSKITTSVSRTDVIQIEKLVENLNALGLQLFPSEFE